MPSKRKVSVYQLRLRRGSSVRLWCHLMEMQVRFLGCMLSGEAIPQDCPTPRLQSNFGRNCSRNDFRGKALCHFSLLLDRLIDAARILTMRYEPFL